MLYNFQNLITWVWLWPAWQNSHFISYLCDLGHGLNFSRQILSGSPMVLFPFLVTCGHCVGSHKFIFQDLFLYLVSATFSCILIMFIFVFWLLDMVAAGRTSHHHCMYGSYGTYWQLQHPYWRYLNYGKGRNCWWGWRGPYYLSTDGRRRPYLWV